MNKPILFDIDGILIKSEGFRTTSKLIKKHFELDSTHITYNLDVKEWTYRAIFCRKLELLGIKNPEELSNFEEAIEDPSALIESIESGERKIEKIPGAEKLVQELVKRGYIWGLLTGNSPLGAKAKLENVGLWHYFKFGAFGTKAKKRIDLIDVAILETERVEDIEISRENIFLIGDTKLDVECARGGRVKIIAIATGKESMECLKKSNPDFLFKDFSDIEGILNCFGGENL